MKVFNERATRAYERETIIQANLMKLFAKCNFNLDYYLYWFAVAVPGVGEGVKCPSQKLSGPPTLSEIKKKWALPVQSDQKRWLFKGLATLKNVLPSICPPKCWCWHRHCSFDWYIWEANFWASIHLVLWSACHKQCLTLLSFMYQQSRLHYQ